MIPAPPAIEQARDPGLDRRQHLRDVEIRDGRRRMQPHAARFGLREHPVQHERVQVRVQIQRAAKSLNDDHGAPAPVRHAVQAGASAQPAQHAIQAPASGR